jgi:tRNA-intron endonuclease
MSEKKSPIEFRTKGIIVDSGVKIIEQSSIDALSTRGYGKTEEKIFTLTFFEALYLQEKGMLEVKDPKGEIINFQSLLQYFESRNENAWTNYLVYRDLRNRGYVVREGFGNKSDFRIYERGNYGKEVAPYLILSMQEGKPLLIKDLLTSLEQCKSQKKELILAVMNRRGEIVHYSVSELVFSKIE